MNKEQIKKELTRRYTGQRITPGSIIDIVADAIELSKQNVPPPLIVENKKIESIPLCHSCKAQWPNHLDACPRCGEEYEKGSTMKYVVSVDQGDISSSYWCEVCEEVLSTWKSWEMQDGIGLGELKDNDPNWEKTKNEMLSA